MGYLDTLLNIRLFKTKPAEWAFALSILSLGMSAVMGGDVTWFFPLFVGVIAFILELAYLRGRRYLNDGDEAGEAA